MHIEYDHIISYVYINHVAAYVAEVSGVHWSSASSLRSLRSMHWTGTGTGTARKERRASPGTGLRRASGRDPSHRCDASECLDVAPALTAFLGGCGVGVWWITGIPLPPRKHWGLNPASKSNIPQPPCTKWCFLLSQVDLLASCGRVCGTRFWLSRAWVLQVWVFPRASHLMRSRHCNRGRSRASPAPGTALSGARPT